MSTTAFKRTSSTFTKWLFEGVPYNIYAVLYLDAAQDGWFGHVIAEGEHFLTLKGSYPTVNALVEEAQKNIREKVRNDELPNDCKNADESNAC